MNAPEFPEFDQAEWRKEVASGDTVLGFAEWREHQIEAAQHDDATNASGKRVIARFLPQAWVRDNAMQVDPEGPVEFDVTAAVLAMGKEASLAVEDSSYESDHFREVPTAPKWIREWSGPFEVEVAESIAEFWKGE